MSKTRKIYYITRNGNSCKTTGIKAYSEELQNNYDMPDTEFIFFQGTVYNNPEYLLEQLKNDNDAIVLLSMPESSAYFMNDEMIPDKMVKYIIPILEEGIQNNIGTSWEIFYDFIKKQQN